MRLHGSLTRKHFLAQLKHQQWRRKRRRKTPVNNNKQKSNTAAARSDKYLSPKLNKSSWGAGRGEGGPLRKYSSHFMPAVAIQMHSVSHWVTLFIKQGDKLLTSPLFSIASADTDKDAQGEECMMGEKTCKRRKREEVEKERKRWGGGEGGENETSCTDCNQSGWLQLQASFSKIGDEYENICVARQGVRIILGGTCTVSLPAFGNKCSRDNKWFLIISLRTGLMWTARRWTQIRGNSLILLGSLMSLWISYTVLSGFTFPSTGGKPLKPGKFLYLFSAV